MTTLIAERYQIQRILGQGGMATVYLAHDAMLDREVALKVLRADLQGDPAAVARFQSEARTAAGFNHQHIARVYDVGVDTAGGYGPFFVQELIPGQQLDALLPVPAPQALRWASEIAGALAAIHAQGVVHCDIKPQNVRITPEGQAVLLDFGIAQTSGAAPGGVIFGTPQYLAPERAGDPHTGAAAPTPAADVYALGILLYELLTGRVPLDGTSATEIVQRHLREGVPAIRQALPGTAGAVETIIRRATERDPGRRYRSVEEMLGDLAMVEQGANSPTVAMGGPLPQRATVSIHNTPTLVSPPAGMGGMAAASRSAPAGQPAPRPQAQPEPAPAAALPQAAPPAPLPLQPRPAAAGLGAARKRIAGGVAVALLLALTLILRPKGAAPVAEQPAPPPSNGSPATPPLVGLQLEIAQDTAQRLGLRIEVERQVRADVPAGQIIAQNPAADAPIAPNGVINVAVSAGSGDAAPPPPAPPAPPADDKGKGKDGGKGKGKDK